MLGLYVVLCVQLSTADFKRLLEKLEVHITSTQLGKSNNSSCVFFMNKGSGRCIIMYCVGILSCPDALVRYFDVDGDGEVDYLEFLRFCEGRGIAALQGRDPPDLSTIRL